MSKIAVRFWLCVVFLLALTACSGSNAVQSGSTSALATGAPSTENTTAVEQPLPARGGNPGISVASLPIGGQSEGATGTDGAQCVRVNWILSASGDTIPSGLAVEITSVAFEPDAYRVADNPCQEPPCIGHIFRASELVCDLPIRPTDASATGLSETEQVSVSAQGRVLCTDYGDVACKTFVSAVRGSPQTLTVPLPISPQATQDSAGGSGATPQPQVTSTSSGG
jgi:hypothetical protein